MSKHGKRTNQNRIPLSASTINVQKIIDEENSGNMYRAYLLLTTVLIEQETLAVDRIVELWNEANQYADNHLAKLPDTTPAVREIEEIIGLHTPYPQIDFSAIRTQGDLAVMKRKLKRNALHAAFCTIALGFRATRQFTDDQLRLMFLNADITLAEVECGMTTFDRLQSVIQAHGIIIKDRTKTASA